jgi:hypothetical protein
MAEEKKDEQPTFIIDTRDGKKPDWSDMPEHELHQMFEGVYNYCEDGEIDNLEWDRLNFNVFDEDWYRDKYGEGFPDEYYKLMADSTKEENKIQDYRQHPLKIERKEIVVTMS